MALPETKTAKPDGFSSIIITIKATENPVGIAPENVINCLEN